MAEKIGKAKVHLTVEEVADRYGTTPDTVRHWVKTGKRPHSIKPGRRRLFPMTEILSYEQEMLANGGIPQDAA